ncbi:MAG TPA: manganese catalase family protein [Falsiroseomonas sp.]|jgi:Mn-containing catalase|nr:manganese catalase family protein [Falsiroseomonas sp.]
MFHHAKELQFNARVTRPDPRFARLLLEQFGGGNGELKAAMQYFVQAFAARRPYPDKYDLLMDIATEELSHLEIVGATITMLLDGVNGELKDAAGTESISTLREAAEANPISKLMSGGTGEKERLIHEALFNPQFLVLTGGGPALTNSQGVPWQGSYVNANGDLTVDLRSDIAAESRAKIVYEYLMKFTDDPAVKDTLGFLMTREIAHFQMFSAALDTIQPNFPPGVLQGDPRHTHTYFNMSNGADARGPWNQGQGPWGKGEQWQYVEDPHKHVVDTKGEVEHKPQGTKHTMEEVQKKDAELSRIRSQEVKSATPKGEQHWSDYPQMTVAAPSSTGA